MSYAIAFPPTVARRLLVGGERVIVTGASGWLGQALLEMLDHALGAALADRVVCFGSFPKQIVAGRNHLQQRALSKLAELPVRPSVMFHLAYMTKERALDMPLDEYIRRNRAISAGVAHDAALVGAARIFVSSSGAASQAEAACAGAESRHAYGVLKLEDEALFRRYAFEGAHRKVFAARVFNLSGPHINKLASYALSSFIEQARHTGIIQIKSAHPVFRSYTSVENLLGISMGHLLWDDSPTWTCAETAGDRMVEVGELAECVKAVLGTAVEIQRPPPDGAPEDRYVGDGTGYRAMAAKHAVDLTTLECQVHDTYAFLSRCVPTTAGRAKGEDL